MMKNLSAYFVLFILTLLASNLFANDEIKYPATFNTTDVLNIRQYPNKTSKKMGVLEKDTKIVIDSLYNKRWACITYNNNIAYISTHFIAYQHNGNDIQKTSFFDTIKNWNLWGNLPLISPTGIIISCSLLLIVISYLSFIPTECIVFYVLMFFIGWIGYFFGSLKWCLITIGLYVGFFIFATLLSHKVMEFLQMVLKPIYALNQLQHFLQKPWRPFLKNRNNLLCRILKIAPAINPSQHPFQRLCYRMWNVWHIIISFVFCLIQFALYIVCVPLRLVNAIYYNIIVHIPCALHDYAAEVFNPKGDGMRHLGKWDYWSQYFLKMPYRIYKFLLKRSLVTSLESVIYTIIDIFVPTITMYHGTSCDASHKITGNDDVTFKVGGGNYAGNGIYFAIDKDTAEHYSKGVVIISRVSLGRVLNVNITPDEVRNYVAHDGHKLADWGLQRKVKTIEWWRSNGEWWEYCMLQISGIYKDTWRIRPLYIENRSTGFKERIYKGMAPWLFK